MEGGMKGWGNHGKKGKNEGEETEKWWRGYMGRWRNEGRSRISAEVHLLFLGLLSIRPAGHHGGGGTSGERIGNHMRDIQ